MTGRMTCWGSAFGTACRRKRSPVQRRVVSLIHLAHAALVDLGGDLVDAEPGAEGQGHGAVPILPLAGWGVNAAHAGARRPTRGRDLVASLLREVRMPKWTFLLLRGRYHG